MKKSSKLLSLLLSTSLASQMISSVNINATKDSITFYDVKNNILDIKAYDAELDTNHDGNMNVFDVIRANKTLIQEESYTDLKEKVYMLETQIESLYQKLNEKTDAEEGKQLSSNDFTDEEKQKLESLNNYDDTKINEKIDSLVQTAYEEKKEIVSSIDNKVDKEEGKQLSSNDYTDEEKKKLENLNDYDDTDIKNEIDYLKNELASASRRKIYLPKYENSPVSPYDIYYDGTNYSIETGFVIPENYIYVKPANSAAKSIGNGTESNPYNNFETALNNVVLSTIDTTIVMIPNGENICEMGYFTSNIPETTLNNIKIAIIPYYSNERIVWSNYWEGMEFTETEGVFASNSTSSWNGAFDTSYRDENGVIIPYKRVNTITDCMNEKATFYINSDNKIYVNPVNTIFTVRCTVSGNSINFILNNDATLYMKNVDIINPTKSGNTANFHTDCQTLNNIGKLICENCNSSGALRDDSRSDGGFGFHIQKHSAIMINCNSAYNTDDGFDYMHTPEITLEQAKNAICIEINCKGYENGNPNRNGYDTNIANASTAHNLTNIIRCGCEGWNCAGPIFADVGSAKVINYDCIARDSLSYTNGHGFLIQSDNIGSEGYMWCLNCTADGILTSSVSIGETSEKAYAYVSNMNSFIAPIINGESKFVTFDSLLS